MGKPVAELVRTAVDLVYPPTCPACERHLGRGTRRESPHALCTSCKAEARPIAAPFCATCGEPYSGSMRERFVCSNCQDQRFAFDFAIAAYHNEGPVRELVHGLKYQRRLALRRPLARLLARSLEDERLQSWNPSLVPVPLFPTRQRERGFNQAGEIARYLAKITGLPVSRDLERKLPTGHQALLGKKERQQNLRDAFTLRRPLTRKEILLIDDVLTTGSTADACAKVLREAGAERIAVLTVARG